MVVSLQVRVHSCDSKNPDAELQMLFIWQRPSNILTETHSSIININYKSKAVPKL